MTDAREVVVARPAEDVANGDVSAAQGEAIRSQRTDLKDRDEEADRCVSIFYALNKHGVVVRPEHVTRETDGPFQCLGCGDVLAHANGKIVRRYFRHNAKDRTSPSCVGGSPETGEHRFCKAWLAEHHAEFSYQAPYHSCTHLAAPWKTSDFSAVGRGVEEVRVVVDGTPFIPDVTLHCQSGDSALFIEVFHTHAVSGEKSRVLPTGTGVPVAEIRTSTILSMYEEHPITTTTLQLHAMYWPLTPDFDAQRKCQVCARNEIERQAQVEREEVERLSRIEREAVWRQARLEREEIERLSRIEREAVWTQARMEEDARLRAEDEQRAREREGIERENEARSREEEARRCEEHWLAEKTKMKKADEDAQLREIERRRKSTEEKLKHDVIERQERKRKADEEANEKREQEQAWRQKVMDEERLRETEALAYDRAPSIFAPTLSKQDVAAEFEAHAQFLRTCFPGLSDYDIFDALDDRPLSLGSGEPFVPFKRSIFWFPGWNAAGPVPLAPLAPGIVPFQGDVDAEENNNLRLDATVRVRNFALRHQVRTPTSKLEKQVLFTNTRLFLTL
jgi:hypothetical protein